MKLRAYYKLMAQSFQRSYRSAMGYDDPVSLEFRDLVTNLKDDDFNDRYVFVEFLRFASEQKTGPHAHLISQLLDLIAEQRQEAFHMLAVETEAYATSQAAT